MKLKYISWIPAVLLMIIIFLFSAKPAVNSNESSLSIASRILSTYEDISNLHFSETERIIMLNEINHMIRKGAHFSEYALLANTLALHLLVIGFSKRKLYLYSVVLASFYAATDELHQKFVEGRSGQLSDVLIDASGAVVGAFFFLMLISVIGHYSKKHRIKQHQ
ncbi:MAG: VanZ family protein [Mobilitalea sp.]